MHPIHPIQLKIQQLWYFMDVAHTASFTRAAERNFTSQSNISYAVRELERALDVQLFIRRNNEIILTKYGEAFLPYVERTFAELECGCKRLYEMTNPYSGNVRVCFSFIFSLSFVPSLFRFVYKRAGEDNVQMNPHPIMVHTSDQAEIIEDMVLNGTCDLGLTCVRCRDNVDYTLLGELEHVLLLPSNHPLAGKKSLRLEDVKNEPFILLNSDNEITGNYYLRLFDSLNISPNLINTGMDWLSLLVEVSAGKCLTIAPKSNLAGYDIASVALDHPQKNRELYLAWSASQKLSPAANYCRQLILEYYGFIAFDKLSRPENLLL